MTQHLHFSPDKTYSQQSIICMGFIFCGGGAIVLDNARTVCNWRSVQVGCFFFLNRWIVMAETVTGLFTKTEKVLPKQSNSSGKGFATNYFYADETNNKKYVVCISTWAREF